MKYNKVSVFGCSNIGVTADKKEVTNTFKLSISPGVRALCVGECCFMLWLLAALLGLCGLPMGYYWCRGLFRAVFHGDFTRATNRTRFIGGFLVKKLFLRCKQVHGRKQNRPEHSERLIIHIIVIMLFILFQQLRKNNQR